MQTPKRPPCRPIPCVTGSTRAPVHAILVAALLLPVPAARTVSGAEAPRPNIVVIMVDDMGWSDMGCYGGDVRTPNIDSLAETGLRFTQFYNAGRCCPTRAALLSGLYPHQAGVGRMTFDRDVPGYRGRLTDHCVTIAEMLRDNGYRTAMVGKWHLSLTETREDHMRHLNNRAIRETFSDVDSYPVGRGFEEHYGVIWGVVNFFDPFSLVHDTEPVRSVPEDYYITDALSDRAVDYAEKYSQGEEPFFLYLAHTAPHWPLHALPEDIEKYEDTYTDGWQAVREARYRRQVEMGLIDPETAPLSDRHPADSDWSGNPHRDWDARAMAVHAAMIDRVDQGVGRLIAKLKELGLYENTLILFLSDNGASPERPGRPGFDRPSETRGGREIRYFGRNASKDVMPGPETTFAGIGPHWANASNAPLRYWKATQHEGGIRTPLIVHWPKGLKTEPGSLTDQPGHVIDIMATCLDVAGAEYPSRYNGHEITPLEGESLLPILKGRRRDGHDALFWEHFGAKAVRKGDWKLVSLPDGEWELYNLSEDETETTNLAEEQAEKVRRLKSLWEDWAERAHIVPRPGEASAASEDKRRFELDAGERLSRNEAPQIDRRPFAVTATITADGEDGVIVAQGGRQAGFALFVADGVPGMATQVNGEMTVLRAPGSLPEGKVEIGGRLAGDGTLRLMVAGREVASGRSPGTIPVVPIDALEVGRDSRTQVGPYGDQNAFGGTVHAVRVELGERVGAEDE